MIPENIEKVRKRITRACQKAGRDPSNVTLLAVSKTFPADFVREAARAGIRDIGENYVQELVAKRELLTLEDIRWHFIGHLQSNKVKYIADWIHLVHAVDNVDLARELNKRAAKDGRKISILIEVNTTGESSKFGLRPENTVRFVETVDGLENLTVAGLMTIGPFLPDPEGSRPMFRELRKLRDRISQLGQGNVEMAHLSMGMTGDFEVAIEEGATIVRIGTAIFGSRTGKPN